MGNAPSTENSESALGCTNETGVALVERIDKEKIISSVSPQEQAVTPQSFN